MALPNDILNTLKDLKRRVLNLETNPQPPNIAKTVMYTSSVNTIHAASHQTTTHSIAVPTNGQVLGIPEITVYKNSVSPDNDFPFAPGWEYEEALNFRIHWWFDESSSDGNNLRLRLFLANNNDFEIDIVFRIRFRYLQQGGTSTVS